MFCNARISVSGWGLVTPSKQLANHFSIINYIDGLQCDCFQRQVHGFG